MMIPTVTIGVPSSHCFVRVHDDRATNSGEMKVEMGKAIRRENQNIPFLYLQNQTGLVQHELPSVVGTKGDDDTEGIIISINMSFGAHLNVENEARERVSCRHVVEGQDLAKNTKSVKGVRKMFLEDIANDFTDVLENVRNRLKSLGVVLDGLSQIRRSLVVVAAAVAIPVQKMRMNVVGRPITLTADKQTRRE